jgi:Skp family chaperone for outer membrane proteins
MEENNIRIVLDKQSVLMGDKTLEITEQVITILNKEVSKLKLN